MSLSVPVLSFYLKKQNAVLNLGVVAWACSASTQEAEAGGLQAGGQPRLHARFCLSSLCLVETLSPCALACLARFLWNTGDAGETARKWVQVRTQLRRLSHPVAREGRILPVKPRRAFNHLGPRQRRYSEETLCPGLPLGLSEH